MQSRSPFRPLLTACATSAALLAGAAAHAQAPAWPGSAPIRLVVPFTAGSGTDVIARALGERLGARLGTQIVVENRPGAGGTVGAAQVAKAAPDGHTFLIHSSGHLVNPSIYPQLPYDTLKDFEGITPLASLPNVLVASPQRGWKTAQDLVKQARSQPGALFYASAGNGSATHMNAEQFRLAAGIDAQHVPFRGTPEAITETVAGRTQWFFAPLVSALPMIKEGRLQALAVGTKERSAALPDVPSMVEAGLPDAVYTFWVGLFAPANVPAPIVERMHREVLAALETPEIRTRFANLGAAPMPMSQKDFARYLSTETQAAGDIVKKAGIRAQ